MKPIEKHEIYEHLSHFLKAKGIEMKEGSYSHGVQKGCEILADTINLSQRGLERAKVTIDKGINQVRQVIHEKTAPKRTANRPPSPNPMAKAKATVSKAVRKTPARKKPKSRKKRS